MPHIEVLPEEVLLQGLDYLSLPDVLRCERLSRRFRHVVRRHTRRLAKRHERGLFCNFGDSTVVVLPETTNGAALGLTIDHVSQRPGEQEDLLKLFDEEPCIRRHLATTMNIEMATLRLLKKMTRLFTFTTIRFYHINGHEFVAECCRLFPALVNVSFIENRCADSAVLQCLDALPRVEALLISKPFHNGFLPRFFYSPLVGRLRSFKVVLDRPRGLSGEDLPTTSDLDNGVLWQLSNLKNLWLSLRTRTTLEGIRTLIEAWRDSRRELDNLTLGVLKSGNGLNVEGAYQQVHDCDLECRPFSGFHVVSQLTGRRRLRLIITGLSETHWLVSLSNSF